ncbi:hypothetical protein [Rhodococcus globerulus]|uniref:hypothetical protein n=1 Tax=Rhodococcus globerulus TaxID=33008 RepID=UPI001F34B283|nr:hypothetical protein [Rhodococcus globerulus]MCE4267565.1 hypothetical protein [Rhodococcus globerulus]
MTADNSQRQAVAIAAYLAQFNFADPTIETTIDPRPGYADLPDEDHRQRHRDYLRAAHWAQSPALTDEDIQDLREMRRRYGFPS